MFEKFTSSGASDFRQRYIGTFGFFRDGDMKVLCRLTNIQAEGGTPFVEFKDHKGQEYMLRADSKVESRGFEFLPPKNVWCNTSLGIPLLVERVPARQYSRGICDRNTSIRDLSSTMYPVDFETLLKLYDDPITVTQAMEAFLKVRKDKVGAGIAISPQFAVSEVYNRINCFNTKIGKCEYDEDKHSFAVILEDPDMWLTEVTDAFHRAGLEATVK